MAKTPQLYTRLTRNAASVGSYSSLWLAADHLMIVRSTGYTESYARLQLGDLKGIFLTASDRRMWWGITWGVFAVLGGMVMIVTLAGRGTPMFSAFFFLMGAIGLVANHLLGPGCRAYVLTGVQTAELPSLVRMKKARRIVAQLQPLIAAAQAGLTVRAVPPATPAASAAGPAVAAGSAGDERPNRDGTPASGGPTPDETPAA